MCALLAAESVRQRTPHWRDGRRLACGSGSRVSTEACRVGGFRWRTKLLSPPAHVMQGTEFETDLAVEPMGWKPAGSCGATLASSGRAIPANAWKQSRVTEGRLTARRLLERLPGHLIVPLHCRGSQAFKPG